MRDTTTWAVAVALSANLTRESRQRLRDLVREAVDRCETEPAPSTGFKDRNGRDWQLLLDLEVELTRRL